jgi:DnaK suppressor protein
MITAVNLSCFTPAAPRLPGIANKGYQQVFTDQETARAALAAALEEQYQLRTKQLTGLVTAANRADPATAATIVSCRQALADIARALRNMAEGRYGECESCEQPIALQRLEILPEARLCGPCQQHR